MLDLNNPKTDSIFEASAYEDQILKLINQVDDGEITIDQLKKESLEDDGPLSKLYSLNIQKFDNSREIEKTLDIIKNSIMNDPDISTIREKFYLLNSFGGANFGTWAI
jgi:hypothetical protein